MTLVSARHGLIFVKTVKTAGTSIEVDLSQRLEPEAIVTPIQPALPGHQPRNFARGADERFFFNHMPAALIRHRLGADRFAAMTRFCVEREPLSKCISHYHMLRNSALHGGPDHARLTWADYVAQGQFPVDLPKYTEGPPGQRRLLVTHVLRYDRLTTELPALLARCGIQGFALTARAKSEYSRQVHVRPEDVTPAQRAIIRAAFAETAEVTGLTWPESTQPQSTDEEIPG